LRSFIEAHLEFVSFSDGGKKRHVMRCRERLGGLLKYYEREAAQKSAGQRAIGSQ